MTTYEYSSCLDEDDARMVIRTVVMIEPIGL